MRTFLIEDMEDNSAVSERGSWMNKAFMSEEVLGNKSCQREKEEILMKKKNEWVVPDKVISRIIISFKTHFSSVFFFFFLF